MRTPLKVSKEHFFCLAAVVLLFSSTPTQAQDDDDVPTAVPLFCMKECLNPCVAFGSPVFYRVTINNPDASGTVNLTNVIVIDDQPAPGTIVATFDSLNSGQTVVLTNSYIPNNSC